MTHLPQQFDPVKLAKNKTVLSGQLPLNQFPRLEKIAPQTENVTFDIQFDVDKRLTVLSGHLSADVILICQLCNTPVHTQIDSNFNLSPVHNDAQAKQLPVEYDPVMIDGEISLTTMIEEEILLALPMIPKHLDACPIELPDYLIR